MKRLALVFTLVLCASCAQDVIAPPAGALNAGARAPIAMRVLVLSDGISEDNKPLFEDQVRQIKDVFASLPGHQPGDIDVTTDFQASSTHGAGSRFGLVFDEKAPCYFRFTESNSAMNIVGTEELVAARDPGAYRYIVIYGEDEYVGCARNKVMFIDLRTTPKTIKHEMGHALGGLYDERRELIDRSTLMADDANCTTKVADPPWKTIYPAPAQTGCDTSPALYHPSQRCIMISPGTTKYFCNVCKPLLEKLFADWRKASSGKALTPAKRVTAVLTSDGQIRHVHSQPATAFDRALPVTSESFIVASRGGSAFEIGRIVGVAPLAIDARPTGDAQGIELHARAYAGEEIEKVVPVESALISFTVTDLKPIDTEPDALTLRIRSLVNPGRAKLLTPETRERLQGTKALIPGDATLVLPP